MEQDSVKWNLNSKDIYNETEQKNDLYTGKASTVSM